MKQKGILLALIWTVWIGFVTLPFLGWVKASYLAAIIFAVSFLRFVKPSLPKVRIKKPKINLVAIRIAMISILLIVPIFFNRYFQDILVVCGIYVLLSLGINIVVGLAGLLILGFIAFYAIGAYTYALLSVHFHIPFFLCVPISAALATIFGILVGLPALRLRGDYLAIVTLGFGEITRIVLNNWDELTRGPNGILGIARPEIMGFKFTTPLHYYYLILCFVILGIFIFNRLNNSRLGRAWIAIKEDELAASTMGINVTKLKLLAFAISAAYAGIGGAFFASKMTHVSPESFTFLESALVLCMIVLGGMGSVRGAIVGAACLIIIPEFLREFANLRMLLFGMAMILMMRFRPEGLFPYKAKR